MELLKEIEKFILMDRSNIHSEIKKLSEKLGIKNKLDSLVPILDDIDYMYLRNLDLLNSHTEIQKQIKDNENKTLELNCVIKGKKVYLKSFGLIKNISVDMIDTISQFLLLFKISKRLYEVSNYSSRYYKNKENSNIM